MKQVDIRNVLGKRLVKRKKILYIVSIIKMRKLLSIVLATILMLTFSVSALAQTRKQALMIEVPMLPGLEEQVIAQVTHEDGTITDVIPELHLYEIADNSRSNGGAITYALDATVKYTNKSQSGITTSKKADATIDGRIYFRVESIAEIWLTDIEIEFTAGPEVQMFNESVWYTQIIQVQYILTLLMAGV